MIESWDNIQMELHADSVDEVGNITCTIKKVLYHVDETPFLIFSFVFMVYIDYKILGFSGLVTNFWRFDELLPPFR